MKQQISFTCPHCGAKIKMAARYDISDPTADCFSVFNCGVCANRIAINMIFFPQPEIYAHMPISEWTLT